MASLTFLTPSSSLRSRASRSGPSDAGVRGVLGVLGVFGVLGGTVCWGEAQMSVSVYSESSAMAGRSKGWLGGREQQQHNNNNKDGNNKGSGGLEGCVT